MKPTQFFLSVGLLAVTVWVHPSWAQELDCDEGFVALKQGYVELSANGENDTANLQCALDYAVANQLTAVRLKAGEFLISHVQAEGFNGVLEGRSQATTRIHIMNASIDCATQWDAGRYPAGVKFIDGRPRLSRMTLAARAPCAEGDDRLFPVYMMLHFTGGDALSGCEASFNHGMVENVDFLLDERPPAVFPVAVAVTAEGWLREASCRQELNGTFKMNRARILGGFEMGLVMGMRGAALVDVSRSEFEDNTESIRIDDANQLMTIQASKFRDLTPNEENNWAIVLSATRFDLIEDPPRKNRLVIYRNTFDMGTEDVDNQDGALLLFSQPYVDLGLVITDNNIGINNNRNGRAVAILNTPGPIVANNLFRGRSDGGLSFNGDVVNAAVTGNQFENLELTPDSFLGHIYFDDLTRNNLVGPGQGATIRDRGQNNTILDQ